MASFHKIILLTLNSVITHIVAMTKTESKQHLRVERIVVRQGHEAFKSMAYCCQVSRRVKNATHYLVKHEKKPNGKAMSHRDADKWLKQNNPELYKKLPSALSQRMTQVCGAEWSSFFGALKGFKKNPESYDKKPQPPRYANKATTTYIGRNGFRFEDGNLHFAGDIVPPITTSFGFSQNWNAKKNNTIAQEVRLVPMGNCYVVEIIYNPLQLQAEGSFSLLLDRTRKAGIDLGVNNLVAFATDQPDVRPVLINGKPLKSINAWYNKRAAELRSLSNYGHLGAIANKRHHQIRDYLHRASRFVADHCVSNNIGTLVIGLNQGWKKGVNTGKVNNQKFVHIPHTVLIEQIKYKCYALGINVIVREESYTSKASALDNDPIPAYGDEVIPLFSGRRTKRGLYKTDDLLINADVNSALNILRKETGEAFGLACRGCVCQPTRVTLGHSPRATRVRRENTKHQQAA